jgi:hypothetical protein
LSYQSWGRAVRAGRTFATNGPLIDIHVEGRPVGDVIRMPAGGGTVSVQATAESMWPLGVLEVLFNGKVVAAEKAGKGAHSLEVRQQVKVPGTGWIGARCRGPKGHFASYHLAHTSPVYVQCGRTRAFDGPAIEHMLTLVRGGIEYLETLSVPHDDVSHRGMLRLFEEVRRELQARLTKSQ